MWKFVSGEQEDVFSSFKISGNRGRAGHIDDS